MCQEKILKLLNRKKKYMGVTEISKYIDVNKSNIHKAINKLYREGYLLRKISEFGYSNKTGWTYMYKE